MPDPREAKLPKWVQEELRVLRRKLSDEQAAREELRGNIPDANVFVRDYLRNDRPLPVDARVAFHLTPDDGRVRNSVSVHIENGKLRIQGDCMILVRPTSGNSLTIEMDR